MLICAVLSIVFLHHHHLPIFVILFYFCFRTDFVSSCFFSQIYSYKILIYHTWFNCWHWLTIFNIERTQEREKRKAKKKDESVCARCIFFQFIFPSLKVERDVLLPQICLFYFRFIFIFFSSFRVQCIVHGQMFCFLFDAFFFSKMLMFFASLQYFSVEWNVILHSSIWYFRCNLMSTSFFLHLCSSSKSHWVRHETHMKYFFFFSKKGTQHWQDRDQTTDKEKDECADSERDRERK